MSFIDMSAAFFTAVLAGTGIGGGGLFVIYLTMVGSLSQTDAQALNLVFFIAAAFAALPYHIRRRNLNLKLIVVCAVLGCIGTVLGGIFRQKLPENAVRSLFGVMLIFVGIRTLLKKNRRKNKVHTASDGK